MREGIFCRIDLTDELPRLIAAAGHGGYIDHAL